MGLITPLKKIFPVSESVYISATGSDTGTTSISILVFAENKLVADETENQKETEIITVKLKHTFSY